MTIDYNHALNHHSVAGARSALALILEDRSPKSLLDVGCGVGTWVRAAMDYGITDVCGVDGVEISQQDLFFPKHLFQQQDLTQAWSLDRKFDIALCLEVGEHLTPKAALTLVEALTAHSELIVFSAACPGQVGQHHVNCQWPEYWQKLFNARGYACDDSIRWKIWQLDAVEPWYRQNVFEASLATGDAGREPRIRRVFHPEMFAYRAIDIFESERKSQLARIEAGQQSAIWYLQTPPKAWIKKLKRRFRFLRRRRWQ